MGRLEDQIPELMERLGISGKSLEGAKLGPGVVGRNSTIAWALEIVMLAGVIAGAYLHSISLVGGSIIGGVVVALAVAFGNIYFGKTNPAAALLEGAQFIEFHHMQMTATKEGTKTISEPPVPKPLAAPENSRTTDEAK